MATLTFQTLNFKEEKDKMKVILLKNFHFYLEKKLLEKTSPNFKINKNEITFPNLDQNRAEKTFDRLFAQGLSSLKNSLTDNPAIYLHQNFPQESLGNLFHQYSNIPLIGNVSFGLIYRNTSLIEIKPITGCNLNCIYCSVGEGLESKKTDFVIEKDYLIQELKKLLNFISPEPETQTKIEAHIGTNGEPFLYGDIIPLIQDLNNLTQIETVSIDTNSTLLTKQIIDQLSQYKKVRLNLSLHALDQKTAQIMAGCPYNLKKVLEIITYAKNKVKIMLTPLLVPKHNDQEIEPLVKFAKKNNLKIGIQNFLYYKTGRNPAKPWPWEKFYQLLKDLEKKHKIKLIVSPKDFNIEPTKPLPKPFKQNQIVQAIIVCPGRFPNSRIATTKDRLISLPDCTLPTNKKVKIKITRDKHNIFVGKVV